MPDFLFTGTLRVESNDPNSPRQISLKAIQSSYLFPVTFTSYEGEATIHGITELADVSDPPRKYQNLIPNDGGFKRQQVVGGANDLSPILYFILNRTSVNGADVKYQQMQYGTTLSNKGIQYTFPPYTVIPAGAPWWMGVIGGTSGGAGVDSMEELVAPGFVNYGWDTSVPNWFDFPFTKSKRERTLQAPDGFIRDAREFATSPVLVFRSRSIGSTTDSNARFNINITAERGTAANTYNLYFRWEMGQYAIGSGPLARVYIQARRGNQNLTCDATGAKLADLIAGPGSGYVYKYRRFGLPFDTSFRLFGTVAGNPTKEYQFPQDWASEEARITDEVLIEAGQSPWFYLPAVGADVPVSSLLRNQIYKEVLVNEDPLPQALIDAGATESDNQWSRTTGVTGGVAPESYDPITITGQVVKAAFTMTGLTPLQVYTVLLTYEQRVIASPNSVLLQESIEVYPGLDNFADVEVDVIAPFGFERRLYATSISGVVPIPTAPAPVDAVYSLLQQADAEDAGASYTATEQAAIDGFINALATKPYKGNLKYVLPFFGNDLETQLTPIWNPDFYARPTNNGFVDADGSTATGLRGNGSSKYLTMPFRNYTLQTQNDRSGQGIWFNQLDWGGDSGQYHGANWESGNTQIFGLRIGDYRAYYYHGTTSFPAGLAVTEPVTNSHYYGVAFSDSSRKIYKDGLLMDENTSVVNSSGGNGSDCFLFGDQLGGTRECASSMFVAYYTDGSGVWTDANVLDLHNLIQTHLISAVGRSSSSLNPDTAAWKTRVAINSGTLSVNSENYHIALMTALRAWSGYPKLRFTAGWLGADLNAFLTPSYDPALAGPFSNTGFVLGDFSEAAGVQGAGAAPGGKILVCPRNGAELGASNNGGIGWRELDLDFGNTNSDAPLGFNHSGSVYTYWLRLAAAQEQFGYGLTANAASTANVPTNAHYYGQRSSATSRELFKDAVSIASNATNDAATNANAADFRVIGGYDIAAPATYYWAGRSGFMYLTSGDLTAGEITDLHTIVEDFMTLTGRV